MTIDYQGHEIEVRFTSYEEEFHTHKGHGFHTEVLVEYEMDFGLLPEGITECEVEQYAMENHIRIDRRISRHRALEEIRHGILSL